MRRAAPSRDPVRGAVVGLGYWGPNLLRVLSELAQTEVAWICDRDPDRLALMQRRYPDVRATAEVAEALADDDVDALFIATPVFTHHELALQALAAGKHTFVEKPLTSSAETAEELVLTAARNGLRLMCGHTFIYSPAVNRVKQLLDADQLGQVFFVSSTRVNLGLHQRDVSVVWDLGPHDFSILLHWLGEPPLCVRAVGRDSIISGIADVAFVTLEFPSGIIANVELSWLSPSKLRRTVVVGRQKMVVYEDGAPEPIKVYDHGVVYRDPETFGQYHLAYRTGDIVSPKLATEEPLALELADFARSIRTGEGMRAGSELALDVVRVTEAADRSLKQGGAPVQLPRTRAGQAGPPARSSG